MKNGSKNKTPGAEEVARWLRTLVALTIREKRRDEEKAFLAHRGPRFSSWHSHGGSQPSVIPVPEEPTPASGTGHVLIIQTHM